MSPIFLTGVSCVKDINIIKKVELPGVINMAMQIRRGTNAERQLMIPLQGELIFTTDTKKLYVGDGTTQGGIVVDTAGSGSGATYAISAETVSGGANLRLTGSDSSTDNVKFAAGSNVTISRTDVDTITIAATGDGGAVQLGELTDVAITGTPTAGQVLKYDGTNWINDTDETGGGGSATTLDELTDVVITGTPTTGQVLKYNGTNWVNGTDNVGGGEGGATVLDELTDVVITGTPTTGQVLKYDGTNWINDTDSGGATTLDELTDVIITGTPTENDVLQYDGTDWINGPVSLSLGNLDDVNVLGTESTGQFLRYSEISSSWENQSAAIDELSDVVITSGSLVSGQTLVYDGTNWVNDTVTTSLDALSDVVVTDVEISPGVFSLEEGMTLVYDGTNWVNQFAAFDSLSDVAIDPLTLEAGQIIQYNGVIWTPADLTLDTLPDVNFGTLDTNDILYWNGTEWGNERFSISLDDSPLLGGALDLNSFDITGTGNIDITGNILTIGDVSISNNLTIGTEDGGYAGSLGIVSTSGTFTNAILDLICYNSLGNASPTTNMYRARGIPNEPEAVLPNDNIHLIRFVGQGTNTGVDSTPAAVFSVNADPTGTVGATFVPGEIKFATRNDAGVLAIALSLNKDGIIRVKDNTVDPADVDVAGGAVVYLPIRISDPTNPAVFETFYLPLLAAI
jgi:hypothetical protein